MRAKVAINIIKQLSKLYIQYNREAKIAYMKQC